MSPVPDVGSPPDEWVPHEAVVIMLCLDEDGDEVVWFSTSDGMSRYQALGLLEAMRVNLVDEHRRDVSC